MAENDEAARSGQDASCNCVGCRIRAAIIPEETQTLTPKQVREALDALGRNAASLIGQYSTNPPFSGQVFVTRFGEQLIKLFEHAHSGQTMH